MILIVMLVKLQLVEVVLRFVVIFLSSLRNLNAATRAEPAQNNTGGTRAKRRRA